MSFSVRTCVLLMLIPLAMCAVPPFERYTDVQDKQDLVDTNDLTPPQDPAINNFPKEPLLPTCANSGYFRDPYNCGKFYYCLHEQASPAAYYCRQGLIFNELTNYCDDPDLVVC